MKRNVNWIVLFVLCQLFVISSLCFASLPVKYTSEACVSGGKVYTPSQGKRQPRHAKTLLRVSFSPACNPAGEVTPDVCLIG